MCDVENLMIQQQQQVKRKKKRKNWHSPTDASGTRLGMQNGGRSVGTHDLTCCHLTTSNSNAM